MRFLFILIFTFGGLTACDNKTVSDLEQQVQELEEQLENEKGTKTVDKLKKGRYHKNKERIFGKRK